MGRRKDRGNGSRKWGLAPFFFPAPRKFIPINRRHRLGAKGCPFDLSLRTPTRLETYDTTITEGRHEPRYKRLHFAEITNSELLIRIESQHPFIGAAIESRYAFGRNTFSKTESATMAHPPPLIHDVEQLSLHDVRARNTIGFRYWLHEPIEKVRTLSQLEYIQADSLMIRKTFRELFIFKLSVHHLQMPEAHAMHMDGSQTTER